MENCLKFASQIVLKCLYLARIGRPPIFLWSVNKLARAVTQWTKSCDKRLALLISYIHDTSELRQDCYVGNTAQQCRLGLFQDSDFAGHQEDSKSTSGGLLCIFGKSNICTNKLDVQETDFSFTQLNRSRDNISWCRFTHGWNTSSWSLGFGYRSLSLFSNPIKGNQRSSTRKLVAWHHIKQAKPKWRSNQAQESWVEKCWLCFVDREVFFNWCDCLHFCGKWSRD